MRKRLSSVRLLIALFALQGLLPLHASSAGEWHRAGTSGSTEIAGDINYDHPSLNGIEHDTLQPFNLRIYRFGSSVGPDVACQPINDVMIHELKRSR